MSEFRMAPVVAASLLVFVALSSCAPSAPESSPVPVIPAVVDQPGLYETSPGSVRVVGVLGRIESEDRWGVFGVSDSQKAESYLIAIVRATEAQHEGLIAYEGRYVEVRGTMAPSDSESSNIPVIETATIKTLVQDDPADPAR